MSETTVPEKLSEQLMVRLTPAMMARVVTISTRKQLKPADLGRQGLADLLDRCEAEAPGIDAETAHLVGQAVALKIDLKELIRRELRTAA